MHINTLLIQSMLKTRPWSDSKIFFSLTRRESLSLFQDSVQLCIGRV